MDGLVEDHLIDKVKAHFGRTLRLVAALPGEWDDEMLKKLLLNAPAVYLACPGGPRTPGESDLVGINSRWLFYVITTHAGGEAQRRRGDALQIGAWEICRRLVVLFHNHTIPDVGTMDLASIDNLYNGSIENKGVTLYGVRFELPIHFDADISLATLDDFETFHVDFDLEPADGNIDGQTDIDLPQ